MRLLCPAFALVPTRLLSGCVREPAVLPLRRSTRRRPRVALACAGQSGVHFTSSLYVERRLARAQLLRRATTTAPPPAPGAPPSASEASAGAVGVYGSPAVAGAAGVGGGGDGGGDGAGLSGGVRGAVSAAGVYDTHEEFVAGLLAMSGDPLESSGHRVVVHRGNPQAKLMIIGEGPGQEEDLRGLPFVGKAGRLLDDIFTYAGFDMDEQVYVTNVVKRRPPDNRNPTQDEIEYYLPLLLEEIRLVDPGIIVLAGAVPLAAILNLTGITKKRGTIFEVERGGRLREVMPVFHPAYLLRNPAKKAEMKVDIDALRKMFLDKYPEETLAPPRTSKPRR